MKPGCAMRPFFGVQPAVINEQGEEKEGACEGLLAIKAAETQPRRSRDAAETQPRRSRAAAEVSLSSRLAQAAWPSTIRDVFGDYERYQQTYFPIPGFYLTGEPPRRGGVQGARPPQTCPRRVCRRRLPPRRGRPLLDHRPRGRRDQRVWPPDRHGRGRVGRSAQ